MTMTHREGFHELTRSSMKELRHHTKWMVLDDNHKKRVLSSIVPKRVLCNASLEYIGVTPNMWCWDKCTFLCVSLSLLTSYSIATVVRAAHPQLRKRLRKTLTVVGSVEHVLVWIQLLIPYCWYLTGLPDVVSSDSCIHLCWGIHFLTH